MNIWKPASKKTPKITIEAISGESASTALPDVVAGLSYGDQGSQDPALTADTAMMGFTPYSGGPTRDALERRGRCREPRSLQNATMTPQGLGPTTSGIFYQSHQQQETILSSSPPSVNVRRRSKATQPGWSPQRPLSNEGNWNQSAPAPCLSPYETTHVDNTAITSHYSPCGVETLEGARIRSMSSEPHGSASGGRCADRRNRCSSATRNRQPRSRSNNTNNIIELHSSPVRSTPYGGGSNLSPPSASPPVQRIEYQQTATVMSSFPNSRQESGHRSGTTLNDFRDEERHPAPDNTIYTNFHGGGSYGYQVPDLEALLTQASPTRPANLPMVLASSTRLHNMRCSQDNQPPANQQQPIVRPILPLGIIVNAVFKTRDWLYVRTAHGAEGYVPYRVCLPLGILPPRRRRQHPNSAELINGFTSWDLRGCPDANANLPGARPVPLHKPSHLTCPATGAVQPRSRHRGRRRGGHAETTNQTDSQKLRPPPNCPSDNHDTASPLPSTSHVV